MNSVQRRPAAGNDGTFPSTRFLTEDRTELLHAREAVRGPL